LTAEQKHLEIATLLKQRLNVGGQAFLYRIVANDETWIKDFEPELKSQSKEWRSPNPPRPKKFRRGQSKVKQMVIFVYDHRGFIMTCGTSVTATHYRNRLQKLRRKMHKNRPDIFGDGPLILHDNARPHLGKVVTDLLRKYEWEV
jgi:hypothetical protein